MLLAHRCPAPMWLPALLIVYALLAGSCVVANAPQPPPPTPDASDQDSGVHHVFPSAAGGTTQVPTTSTLRATDTAFFSSACDLCVCALSVALLVGVAWFTQLRDRILCWVSTATCDADGLSRSAIAHFVCACVVAGFLCGTVQ